jgi:type II secretory pathway predicted ATPase ExeA/septal ring-binding cell division protein DamX
MTMYLEHFGLREAPFRITPHTEFFFAGANRGATLEALLYAITAGEGMVKVTGEVGSGKTMLCRVLMERLPDTVETIYLAVPSLTRDEMLAAIASDLDIDTTGANTTRLVRALQERLVAVHAAGRQVVALIDEAHAMPLATLEEIRLLSNLETNKEKLLQIVLFGQPELDQHLALPNMRQLKERITHSFTLGPLPPREVDEYLRFRLRAAGYRGPDLFGPEALRIITEASEGLTRRINIYADKTLLAAFAAGTHTVTADHARAAVTDTQIVVTPPQPRGRLVAAAAAGLVVGIAVGFGLARLGGTDAPAPSMAVAATRPAPVQPPSPAPPQPAATLPANAGSAPATPAPEPAPVAAVDPIEGRTAAGRELLGSQARYSVQLMVTDPREREYLEGYLAEAGRLVDPQKLYLVASGTPQTPRVGLVFGAYEARGQAAEALGSLPTALRQFKPYVRSVDALREEARRAQGQ